MEKTVIYYHLNHQCFGTRYFGQYASEFAKMIGYKYREYLLNENDIFKTTNKDRVNEDKINENKIYFPDTLIVDDIKIVYPGTAEELFVLYNLRDPLHGGEKYKQLPLRKPDFIRPINEDISGIADICSVGMNKNNFQQRIKWLKEQGKLTNQLSGFIAYRRDKLVALVEFIREDKCIYPLPEKREDFLFITCLYNFPGLYYEYRPFLFKNLLEFASENKYKGVSVIAGLNTTSPNGPVCFFSDLDFQGRVYLDRVLMRYYWEDLFFLEYRI
ncbi:MAG: hypothetical protein ACLFPF_04830 [Halanaerobiales bacterium]